jgi:16S rRNA (uracil1498-N3)-methyltransferase
MVTPRIFVGAEGHPPVPRTDYTLPEGAARHVAQVLRMRVGDPLALFTGIGGEYAATIAGVDRRGVVVRVGRHDAVERESPWPVTLVQAVIAADMMDLVVRRAVELGVGAVVPIRSARSQHMPSERTARRTAHWRQIAIAACEQCGRNRVPEILPVTPFATWVDASDGTRAAIAMLDATAQRSLAQIAASATPRAIVVGPEGGFTAEELRAAGERGATRVHLGGRTLRAETAALAALATINALAGDAR